MQVLLEKTRKMNELLRNAATEVDFQAIAKVVRGSLECNIFILDQSGHIMGYSLCQNFQCPVLDEQVLKPNRFPVACIDGLSDDRKVVPDVQHHKGECVFDDAVECPYRSMVTTVVPVVAGGERLGTLVLSKISGEMLTPELVLVEHAATVTAMEMVRHNQELVEEEARQQAAVQVALGTLSFSELNAMKHIFDELGDSEGYLVASRIADRVGITRSVIVNALRKFESAGVIETRSLGMKGTYIRVLNEKLLDELNKLR